MMYDFLAMGAGGWVGVAVVLGCFYLGNVPPLDVRVLVASLAVPLVTSLFFAFLAEFVRLNIIMIQGMFQYNIITVLCMGITTFYILQMYKYIQALNVVNVDLNMNDEELEEEEQEQEEEEQETEAEEDQEQEQEEEEEQEQEQETEAEQSQGQEAEQSQGQEAEQSQGQGQEAEQSQSQGQEAETETEEIDLPEDLVHPSLEIDEDAEVAAILQSMSSNLPPSV
ncbi:MAG: hypothetical protein EBT07_05425 [Actinobacteria bacterium]|nr:hypothetical protein [Actinomycetota bacterium]